MVCQRNLMFALILAVAAAGGIGYLGVTKAAMQMPGLAPATAAPAPPAAVPTPPAPAPGVPGPAPATPGVPAAVPGAPPAPATPVTADVALATAATLVDMGDAFMRLDAFDLALTAYKDSLRHEPQNQLRARNGAVRAAKMLREARRIKMAPPAFAPPRNAMPGGMPIPSVTPSLAPLPALPGINMPGLESGGSGGYEGL